VPTFALPATATPAPQSTVVARRGTITATIRARGRVASGSSMALAFPVAGRLDAVYVDPGDQVAAGDVVANLVADDLVEAVEEQTFALTLAELSLEKLEAQEATDLAAAQVAIAQKAAAYEQTVLNGEIAVTQVRLRAEEGGCGGFCDIVLQQTQTGNDIALNIAQAELDAARAAYNATSTGYEFDIAIAEAQLARAQRLAVAASEALSKTILMVPSSGQVVNLTKGPSDLVQAYEPIAQLANPDTLFVTALVLKDDISDVDVGRPATVRLDTGDRTYAGRVTEIDNTPTLWQGQTAYEITVAIEEDGADQALDLSNLGVGVDVTMVGEVREDVLLVPNAALVTFGKNAYVRIAREGNAVEEVAVQTGVTDGDYTEIVDGLSEGQALRIP
jgi:multidrug efflux pump subunit AcrA (membrane-fusion protein)